MRKYYDDYLDDLGNLDDPQNILIENGWFIVPEYIDKEYKPNIKELKDLVWRTYSVHPPLELLN